MISLTQSPLDIGALVRTALTPRSGAVNVFVGTTRNHSHGREVTELEYEAYVPMALQVLEQLEAEARRRWALHNVVIVHRLGRVRIGEASVVVVVSSSHRREAFEASRFLIDTLKQETPIWKREYFADGSVEWSGQPSVLSRQQTS